VIEYPRGRDSRGSGTEGEHHDRRRAAHLAVRVRHHREQ
jgi:hypothetical protein